MSLIAKVAERIPEVISEVTGNELIIAPNIIAPAGDAIQALPADQADEGARARTATARPRSPSAPTAASPS